MMLGINGKRALVTGGAQGIGEAITKALLAEGCKVWFTTRDLDALKRMEVFGATGIDGNSWDIKLQPNFDILVNNAGSTLSVQDPYASTDEYRKVMRLNFEIPRELANQCIPYMQTMGWGRIVNITSCSGMENRGPVAFCCAKAALTAWTRSMGRILAIESPGVVMSAIYPGVVFTKGGHWDKIMHERPEHWDNYKKEIPAGRFGTVEEIAAHVVFQCSRQASFSHGAIIGVDGGLSKGFAHHL
jgi:NAD(P)-dependent dehydrogenase (short-subunit alcohol dehydrogenase family)